MTRRFVRSFWRTNWGGRVLVLLDGFGKAESGNLADGFYFAELIAPDDETIVGWELTCSEHFFQTGGFTEFEEPDALMIDPEFAPEGVRLTELVRRVFDQRAEMEARAMAEARRPE